jgi:hypothetical protein
MLSERRLSSKVTVVWVSKPPSVKEMEPLDGKRNAGSLFPQYLMNAIFGLAIAQAVLNVIRNNYLSSQGEV